MKFSKNDTEMSGITDASGRVSIFVGLGFLFVCLLPFILAWDSMRLLFTLVLTSDTFSQIPVIPFVSLFLIYGNRKAIFSEVSYGWILGAGLITPGMIFLAAARLNVWQLSSANQCSLITFGIVLVWMGAFAFFFGTRAFRAACFPLLFLVFTIPIPEPILSKVIFFLQKGSASVAEEFFRLAGVPYLRQDLIFGLPGVTIRVAEECSGIRSTLALLITAVLASHLFLGSTWRRLLLCIAVVPLAILKNGLRIMALSTLAIYVNPGFLHGNLHHHGGIVFFILALLPLALLLVLLQKGENRSSAMANEA